MSDAFSPVKGKCTWWREIPFDEDRWDTRVKAQDRRINCSCFVEGKGWQFIVAEVPPDCPDNRHCRYYIKTW